MKLNQHSSLLLPPSLKEVPSISPPPLLFHQLIGSTHLFNYVIESFAGNTSSTLAFQSSYFFFVIVVGVSLEKIYKQNGINHLHSVVCNLYIYMEIPPSLGYILYIVAGIDDILLRLSLFRKRKFIN